MLVLLLWIEEVFSVMAELPAADAADLLAPREGDVLEVANHNLLWIVEMMMVVVVAVVVCVAVGDMMMMIVRVAVGHRHRCIMQRTIHSGGGGGRAC